MRFICFALALWAGAFSWAGAQEYVAPSLKAYGLLPGFETASLSPSGDRYAVVGTLGEARKLAIIETDGKPLLLSEIGNAKVRRLEWGGEDKVLVLGSGTYALGPDFALLKYEIGHASLVDIPDRSVKPLMAKGPAGNGTWGEYGVYREKDGWHAYFGGITLARSKGSVMFFEDGHPDLYRVDLSNGSEAKTAQGADGDHSERDWVVGPGGLVATLDFDNRSGDWRIKAGEHGQALASGNDPLGEVRLIGLGRTPASIIYQVLDAQGARRWYELPTDGGPAVDLLGEKVVRELIHDRRTGLLVGYVEEGDYPRAVFFDPALQAKIDAALKPFAGKAVRLKSWNEGFDRLIVHTAGVGDSGTWWLLDLRKGTSQSIGLSYPAVEADDVGPMRMFSYKAADGLQMEGVLTLPPHRPARNLPLVVLPHGGPEARDYPTFDWWAQAFASGGYAVFQPNFRGSDGYGGEFRHAGDGEWGGKMQTDISDGVAELARQGIVDPHRACIVGASYGGYAALAGVTLQNGLYRCAVGVAPVTDIPDMLDYVRDATGQSMAAKRSWLEAIGPTRDQKAISPTHLAERADAPVLLIHGKDDTVVPFSQSKAMERALKWHDKPVELVVLKREDHWLSRGETRLQMLEAAVAFVEKYNPAN